ncbi:MAG: peptide ABC transporter substrate-binding protein [Cyanobacteria bacterium P01_H01_bin.15]
MIFAACGGGGEDVPSSSPSNLKLMYWQAPTILNPHLSTGFKDSEASRITLEPLATFTAAGELVPVLAAEIPSAENGGLAPDGTAVTWILKPNLKWSDGETVTADDIIFTYEFVVNPDVGSTTAGVYEIVESVAAIAPNQIQVKFTAPNPAWNLPFVGAEGSILPKHLFADFNGPNARQAPANLQPVGTGPYRVVEFKPGDAVIFEPNPQYRHAEQIPYERVEIKGGGDATSAARAVLQTGDADYAYNLQVEAPILKQLSEAGKGEIISVFGSLSERLLINHTDPNKATADGERSSLQYPHPFFSDAKVREALSLAIDRNAIADQLYGPTGQATSNFLVAPDQYVSPNTRYTFDIEAAQKLLDDAGWQDSNGDGVRDKDGVEMTVLFQTSVNPLRQKTQEIIKQGLEAIGMSVELKSIDASIFFSSDPGNEDTVEHFYADLQMYTTGNLSPDPANYMKTFTCNEIPQKANSWAGENTSRFCDADYDELWETSTRELNPEKRRQLFIEMNDLLVDNFEVVPLVHRAEVIAIAEDLTGVELTPWDMRTWKISQWQPKGGS